MKRYNVVKALLGWLFRILFRIKFVNRENEPPKELPYIVCSNHSHFFDVVPIGLALRKQVRFMAKKEAFETPFLRGVCKIMGAYSVDRGAGDIGAIKKTIEILNSGQSIAIFPQGTRCSYIDPRETEPKDGVGMIAMRAGVGILPVCVRTKRNKMGLFRRTELVMGDFISHEELEKNFEGLHGMEKGHAITKYAFEKICDLNDGIERKPLPPERIAKIQEEIDRKTHKHK
jgi:1-acyl-sn-glycerol-3-phosphate acyltransferase